MKSVKMNKRRDLKLLWHSNAPWSFSGYGTFTGQLARRLRDDGWKIALSCNYGLQGTPIEWEGIKCYPSIADPIGGDALIPHAQEFGANAVFVMQDIWTLNPAYMSQIKVLIPYVPIDKSPVPQNVLSNLRFAYKIITFAQFGHDELAKSGFSSQLIVEGTDTNIFKPLNKKKELRQKMALPENAFIWCMIGANKENPPRKGFQEALEGFKAFHDQHPDSAMLISYAQQTNPGGFPIKEFVHYLGLDANVFYPNDYLTAITGSSTMMNEFYNASDALLHPSQTEGFGLCIIEAQSAGIPVVIQNSHSMPALIQEGKTGFGASTLYDRFVNDLGFVKVADPKSVAECMEKTYQILKENPEQVSRDCRVNVVANFNIDTLFKEKWVPLLESLQERILPLQSK